MKIALNNQTLTSRLFILALAFVFTFCRDDDKPAGPQFSYTIDGKSEPVENVSAFSNHKYRQGMKDVH